MQARIIKPKAFTNVNQMTQRFKKEEVDVVLSECVAFNETINEQQFEAEVADIEDFGKPFSVVLYINTKNLAGVDEFIQKNQKVLQKLKEKGRIFFEPGYKDFPSFRETFNDKWIVARNSYDQNFPKEGKQQVIDTDTKSFLDRGENAKIFTLKESQDTVEGESLDCLSTLERKDSKENKLVAWFYRGPFFQLMAKMTHDYADILGFKQDSFAHIRYQFDPEFGKKQSTTLTTLPHHSL